MDFETYWRLIGGDVYFSDRKTASELVWDQHPEKHAAIIDWLQKHGQYPNRNPYFFILDFQVKRRQQQLSYAQYYGRYGTTEERDGWKMANPTGNKVIYVKN